MDYDKTSIPESYDRGRSYSPEVLRIWLEALSDYVARDAVRDIVDLGCGTGRFSAPLADHFDAHLVGVDPSEKMLKRAREKRFGSRVTFRQGGGEALPLKDRSADMVFMSMVFHHLREPERVARECHRVLRPDGHVCLRNGTAEEIASFPHLRFFPGAFEIAEARLVSGEGIKAVFAAAGFETAAHRIVVHQMAPSWEALVEKLSHRADSFLAGLSDADFQSGLSALRAHAARADPGESVTANINLFVFRRSEMQTAPITHGWSR